ncbi:MAG: hypothetical protein PWQ51_2086 [Methanolobus sp.]|jgi:hypothetical protein|nr:hypothetical protein [Methanolobus sp.]
MICDKALFLNTTTSNPKLMQNSTTTHTLRNVSVSLVVVVLDA